MVTLLLTSLIISLFCCGLTEISREGRVLYFLRQPFEGIDELVMILRGEEDKRCTRTRLFYLKAVSFISKPLILCTICMASVWGTVIYWALAFMPDNIVAVPMRADTWIICCVISAFLNAFFINLLEKLEA